MTGHKRSLLQTSFLWGLGVLLASQGIPLQEAHAGVVVLKNGEVLVGRVRDEEDTQEELIMRWPYKDRTERGEIVIPKFRVRWYSREHDQPTDEYWEKFENEPIDGRWHGLREKWRLRKKAEQEALGEFLLVDPITDRGQKLSPIPVENEDFKVQKPEGWSSSVSEGITIFSSDKAGAEGFRAQIHVFSVKSAIGSTEDQVRWVEETVARLADGGFEVRERGRLRPRGGGFDQELLTRTVRINRPVHALRKIFFRRDRTYFFGAYAHERDFTGLELLFKACMRSMEIFEDEKAAEAKPDSKKETGGAGGR